jgi:hypothetical protein
VPESRGLPSSLTEYVLVWCEDLLQDLPATARTDLARALSTMHEGGPWPTRLRIQRLAEQASGKYGGANVFVGELHSERPGFVAMVAQKLSEPDPQTRGEALELLGRPPGSPELVRALDQAGKHGRLSPAERAEVLRRALSNPVLPDPVPAPAAYPDLPRDYPESYEEQKRRDPPYELILPRPAQTKDLAKLDEEWKAGLLEVQAYRRAIFTIMNRKTHPAPE